MTDAAAPVELLATAVELVPTDSLEPHPDNPNEGDVGAIYGSAQEVGFFQIVGVQRSRRRILYGEHRWRALRLAGNPETPVVWLDVDDETALAIMAADNELPRQTSRSDPRRLADLLLAVEQARGGRLLTATGYDRDRLDDLLARIQETRTQPVGGATGGGPVAVERDSSYADFLDRYAGRATRALVCDYPAEQFGWLTDRFAELMGELDVDSNAAVILRLVEEATGEEAPAGPEPDPPT